MSSVPLSGTCTSSPLLGELCVFARYTLLLSFLLAPRRQERQGNTQKEFAGVICPSFLAVFASLRETLLSLPLSARQGTGSTKATPFHTKPLMNQPRPSAGTKMTSRQDAKNAKGILDKDLTTDFSFFLGDLCVSARYTFPSLSVVSVIRKSLCLREDRALVLACSVVSQCRQYTTCRAGFQECRALLTYEYAVSPASCAHGAEQSAVCTSPCAKSTCIAHKATRTTMCDTALMQLSLRGFVPLCELDFVAVQDRTMLQTHNN